MNRLSGKNKYGFAYTKIPLNKSYTECETDKPEICYTGFIADRLDAYEKTGLAPEEIPCWNDGPLPKCGPDEMPWFVIETATPFSRIADYMVVRWMGTNWSDKRAERAVKWMPLPQPPKEEK